jgi:hypothetical protein
MVLVEKPKALQYSIGKEKKILLYIHLIKHFGLIYLQKEYSNFKIFSSSRKENWRWIKTNSL